MPIGRNEPPEAIDHTASSYFDRIREVPSQPSTPNFSPDLTFETTKELSCSPCLDTPPLNETQSCESVRKAQSMNVLRDLNFSHVASIRKSNIARKLSPSTSADSNNSASLRRTRSKTLSAAALSVASKVKGRLHKRKRHAIYADTGMQITFSPPEDNQPFSATVIISPELEPPAEHSQDSTKSIDEDSISSDHWQCLGEAIPRSTRRLLSSLSTNTPTGYFLAPRSISIPPRSSGSELQVSRLFPSPVGPLNIKKSRKAHGRTTWNRSMDEFLNIAGEADPSGRLPLVTAMLQELDIAISEWRFVLYL